MGRIQDKIEHIRNNLVVSLDNGRIRAADEKSLDD